MRIWIDFINSPQVTFFIPFINVFKKDHHEILLTCRDSGNTVALLEQRDLQFQIVGNNVGKGLLQKLLFFPKRLYKLFLFLKKERPDIAISQSSFYQPIAAKIFNIPCLYTNDNEHAKGNLLGFLFATKVVLPSALQNKGFSKKWPLKSKLTYYPSVKESIYLSQSRNLLNIYSSVGDKIYFRPEPWSAQYYKGLLNFFDDTLLKLSKKFDVIILPRDKNQVEHYNQEKFKGLTIARKPINLHDILSNCLLFIGAGGSMSREMAVMEIPVISIYQAEPLCVDKYLVERGLMRIEPDISYKEIVKMIQSLSKSNKTREVLLEGQKSYSLMIKLIYNLQYE